MTILLSIFSILCIAARCVICQQRDITWWKAIVPGYNKYLLGKLCNHKKLGVACGFLEVIWSCVIAGVYVYEVWLYQTYATGYANTNGQIILAVPEDIKSTFIILRILVIVIAASYLFVWSVMMWKFSNMHQKSNKWLILWTVVPVIPLCYFALSKRVAMYGEVYDYTRVPVHISKKEKEKVEKLKVAGK